MKNTAPTVNISDLIPRSPHLYGLARDAGISVPAALGHLVALWTYAAKYAPDGDLSAMDLADVEDAAMWSGPAGCLYAPAVHAGFIKEGDHAIKLAGWQRHKRGIRVGLPQRCRAASAAPKAPTATRTPPAPLVAVAGEER
jgi:hypothetical protein